MDAAIGGKVDDDAGATLEVTTGVGGGAADVSL